jgi:hypothetical protein
MLAKAGSEYKRIEKRKNTEMLKMYFMEDSFD